MSRRFGRNQRRRMREALARQQEVIDVAAQHAESLRQHLNHQSSIINHVKEVLGRHFIALESDAANDVVKMEFIHSFLRWPRQMDIGMAFSLMGGEAMSQVLDDMVLYPIETKLGALREDVAVRVVTPCGGAAMYVSLSTLMRMTDDRLRHTLSQEIADLLARQIVKIRNQGDKSTWR